MKYPIVYYTNYPLLKWFVLLFYKTRQVEDTENNIKCTIQYKKVGYIVYIISTTFTEVA